MYKGIFDVKHKLYKVDMKVAPKLIGRPSTGEYDRDILCADCDNNIIGKLESYASKVLFGGVPLKAKTIRNKYGVEYTEFSGIDYSFLKLFLLSILWRASISKRDFFSEIKLGPHEEKIRKIIFEGDPRERDDYPILLLTHRNEPIFPTEYVANPRKTRLFNRIAYVFPIAGIYYIFVIAEDRIDDPLMDFSLARYREVTIFHYPKGRIPKIFDVPRKRK
jgi:hypothetical protein